MPVLRSNLAFTDDAKYRTLMTLNIGCEINREMTRNV